MITAVFLKVAKDNIKDFLFGGKAFNKALGTARKNAESSTIGKAIGYLLMGLTAVGNLASYAAIFLKGYDAATNEKHNLKWTALILHLFSWATHFMGLTYILHYNENARTSKEFWTAEGLLIGFQCGGKCLHSINMVKIW